YQVPVGDASGRNGLHVRFAHADAVGELPVANRDLDAYVVLGVAYGGSPLEPGFNRLVDSGGDVAAEVGRVVSHRLASPLWLRLGSSPDGLFGKTVGGELVSAVGLA